MWKGDKCDEKKQSQTREAVVVAGGMGMRGAREGAVF